MTSKDRESFLLRLERRLEEISEDCLRNQERVPSFEAIGIYKKLIEVLAEFLDCSSIYRWGVFGEANGNLSFVIMLRSGFRKVNFKFPSLDPDFEIDVWRTDENLKSTWTKTNAVDKKTIAGHLAWLLHPLISAELTVPTK